MSKIPARLDLCWGIPAIGNIEIISGASLDEAHSEAVVSCRMRRLDLNRVRPHSFQRTVVEAMWQGGMAADDAEHAWD